MFGVGIVPLSMMAVRLLDIQSLQEKFSNFFKTEASNSNETDISEALQKMKDAEVKIVARWNKLTSSYPQTTKWLLGQWANLCEDESFSCYVSNSFNKDHQFSSLTLYMKAEEVESLDDANGAIDETLEGLWENDLTPLGLGCFVGETVYFSETGEIIASIIPRLTEKFMQEAPHIESGIMEIMIACSHKLVTKISSKIDHEMADQVHRWAKYQSEYPEESMLIMEQVADLCMFGETPCEIILEEGASGESFNLLDMAISNADNEDVSNPEDTAQAIVDGWDSNHLLPEGFQVQILDAEYDAETNEVHAIIIPVPNK